jgi:DNA-binding GntR family transcriptional regulator
MMGADRSPPSSSDRLAAGAPLGTATERVFEGIYRAILERRLAAGTWLREEELATSFSVSRTVVRQALQRLAQHHVVELIHNRGARVPLPELADAEHVFEARRVAECEIARRLGGRLDAAQLRALRLLAAEEQRANDEGDVPRAVRLSGEFHQALARMHGNPVLERLLDSLLPSTSVLMSRFAVAGRPVCVAHRHADLVAALQRGGPDAAAEMKRHLAELQRSLTEVGAPDVPALRDVFAGYRGADTKPAASRRVGPARRVRR